MASSTVHVRGRSPVRPVTTPTPQVARERPGLEQVLTFPVPTGPAVARGMALGLVGVLGIGTLGVLQVPPLGLGGVAIVYGGLVLLFVVSPVFTPLSLNRESLFLRHGWLFAAIVPLSRVQRIEMYDGPVPGRGVTLRAGSGRLFVTPSREGNVLLVLSAPIRVTTFVSRGEVDEIVVSVEEPDRLIREIENRLDRGKGARQDSAPDACHACGRPLAGETGGAAAAVVETPRGRTTERAAGTGTGTGTGGRVDEGQLPEGVEVSSHRVEAMFLIHKDGRLITTYAAGFNPRSAMSIGGMLTVVQDFLRDAFATQLSQGGDLRTLAQGDLTVIVERGRHAYLAVVIDGPEDARLREGMRTAVAEIHEVFGGTLEDWDGDVQPLEDVRRIMSQVLWL